MQCDREMEDSQEFDLTWCSMLLLHGLLPCSEVLCFEFASGLERQSVSVLLQSHTASVWHVKLASSTALYTSNVSWYWALQEKCQPSLIFKPFTIESTHVCHRYLTVTVEMGEQVCGKSWPSICLLQKPSQPSLKFISHQWESSYFFVPPC